MIRTLRAYFLSRLLREKLLLLGFILIGLIWWMSEFGSRAGAFWRAQRTTTATLKLQQQWLDNRLKIEAQAQKAASQLDPAKTLDRARLVTAINEAAYGAGLRNNYSATNSRSENIGQFTVHSVDYTVSAAEYPMLAQFYLNLQKRAPYVGIERFALATGNPNDTSKLTLGLTVSSMEMPR
jgi:hypothetical protein